MPKPKQVAVTCPHCGSDRIVEVSSEIVYRNVNAWEQDEGDDEPMPLEYGREESIDSTTTGFFCRGENCPRLREDMKLSDLVVKDA